MCRLFGFRSAASEGVHDALVLERNSLRRQSLEHPDGWGIASWEDGGTLPRVARGLGAAHLDPEFERASSAVRARTVLAHLRLASVGAVKLDNAHPFTHGRWAFAHNGTLHAFDRHREAVESLILPTFRTFRGETDSERCFALFLTRLSSRVDLAGSPPLADVQWALATTLEEIARITDVDVGNGKRSAMNFLVTDGDLLAAIRRDRTLFLAAESAEGVPIRERPPSGTRLFALEVASEELQGPDVWHEVPQDGVIGIDRDLTFVETSLATLLQRTAGTLARTG